MWFLTGGCFLRVTTGSIFIEQPGDFALTAIPGRLLSTHIPCVLEKNIYSGIAWEQLSQTMAHTRNVKPTTVSNQRVFYPEYTGTYEFQNNADLDYSVIMREVPSDEVQIRCYVIFLNRVVYSSWSNITYIGGFS